MLVFFGLQMTGNRLQFYPEIDLNVGGRYEQQWPSVHGASNAKGNENDHVSVW